MQKLRSMIYRPSEQNMPLFPKFMEFGFGRRRRSGRSKRGMIDGERGNKGGVSLVAVAEGERRLIRPA